MTQAAYAKASGLTPGRVCQLVKLGMPLTSREAADAWRGGSAKKAPASRAKATKEASAKPSAGGYDPLASYDRQLKIERETYDLAMAAVRQGSRDSGRMVTTHALAVRNLFEARNAVLDLEERERALVSGEWVRKVMTDHDGTVAALLRSMPKSLAARIAPHDPEHAEQELERWVQETALATLSKTDPWKSEAASGSARATTTKPSPSHG